MIYRDILEDAYNQIIIINENLNASAPIGMVNEAKISVKTILRILEKSPSPAGHRSYVKKELEELSHRCNDEKLKALLFRASQEV